MDERLDDGPGDSSVYDIFDRGVANLFEFLCPFTDFPEHFSKANLFTLLVGEEHPLPSLTLDLLVVDHTDNCTRTGRTGFVFFGKV